MYWINGMQVKTHRRMAGCDPDEKYCRAEDDAG
jgi:hypothetical protein